MNTGCITFQEIFKSFIFKYIIMTETLGVQSEGMGPESDKLDQPVKSSFKYHLNVVDGKKIGKGLLIAAGGAGVVYLMEILPQIDFEMWTPIVVVMASTLLNTCRKLLVGLKEG